MDRTCLVVGDFNLPAFARSLIETSGNAEKGLSQRYLWLFPKPIYGKYSSLKPIKEGVTESLGKLIFTCY
jgi:hypothetical protein